MGGAHAHASPRAAPRKQLIELEVFLKAKKDRPVSPKSIECRRFKSGDPNPRIPNLPPREQRVSLFKNILINFLFGRCILRHGISALCKFSSVDTECLAVCHLKKVGCGNGSRRRTWTWTERRRREEPRRPRDWTRLESLCYDTPSQMSTTKTRGERGRARADEDGPGRGRGGAPPTKGEKFPIPTQASGWQCKMRRNTRRHATTS